jgi:hypothetical protein
MIKREPVKDPKDRPDRSADPKRPHDVRDPTSVPVKDPKTMTAD